ncbi:MAG: mechanosensitive ion channel domain-containing protein [Thermoanaerobaculales bacterium]|jgi:small conductance mechanosensitive channel|nr:mechanosensitive ion channel domain-containing protein [Thermoanaerobaculales bacterium]
MDFDFNSIVPIITTWGIRVIGAIALLIIGRMVAGIIRGGIRKTMQKREVDATLIPFVSSLVYYLAMAVVVIAVLSLFGIQTASLVAVLGAAGLAVGLALQGTLSNFAAGVMLLVFRPFKVGDFVEAGGVTGPVVSLGIFSTVMRTGDNVMITVPNSQVWGGTISNYNGFDTRRIDLVVGIDYGDDIQLAMDTIKKIVTADERVLAEPAPQIAVAELGASSVDLVVRPWCNGSDYWPLRFDLTRALKEGLEEAGCSFPFPQQDVHMHQAS